MNLEKAVEILTEHNEWRRDKESQYIKMQCPHQIWKAIDTITKAVKNIAVLDGVSVGCTG